MLEKVKEVIKKDILEILTKVMASNNLLNIKVGRNTIYPDSDLFKQLKLMTRNDGDLVYDLMLNDYVKYIEAGRRPYDRVSNRKEAWKHPHGKFPPVEPIVRWARKNGIDTDNTTIYLIRRSIAAYGIRPRPFLDEFFEKIGDEFETNWSVEIFNSITKKLDDFFK